MFSRLYKKNFEEENSLLLDGIQAALLSAEVGEGANLHEVQYLYRSICYVFSILTQCSILHFFMRRNMFSRFYIFSFL